MAAEPSFEWDEEKSRFNYDKHGVTFELAQLAFLDERRVIAEDLSRHGGGRHHDGALHLARKQNPHFRRRLLAQG